MSTISAMQRLFLICAILFVCSHSWESSLYPTATWTPGYEDSEVCLSLSFIIKRVGFFMIIHTLDIIKVKYHSLNLLMVLTSPDSHEGLENLISQKTFRSSSAVGP